MTRETAARVAVERPAGRAPVSLPTLQPGQEGWAWREGRLWVSVDVAPGEQRVVIGAPGEGVARE